MGRYRLLFVRKLRTYFAFALLLILIGPMALLAQSDRQTLRSPFASLVAITEFDFGLPAGSRIGYPLSLGFHVIGGFQANRLFTMGIGVGLQNYGPGDMLLLPMFGDVRMHFPQKKWTPYFALDIGYALSLHPSEQGGFLLNPSAGGRLPLSDNTALGLALGLRLQKNRAELDGAMVDYLSNYASFKLSLLVKLPGLSRRVFKTTMHRMKE